MKRNTFNLYFFIKKKKLLKNGEAPIYARLTINGASKEFGVKRSIEPGQWLPQKGYTKGKTTKMREINSYIDHIRYKIYDIQKSLSDQNKQVNTDNIINTYLGRSDNNKSLISSFEYFNNRFEQLIGKEYTEGTVNIYKVTLKHLKDFILSEYKRTDILLNEVNVKFIRDFEYYLKTTKNIGHNTTIKYIRRTGRIIRLCIANNWMYKNPLEKITLKKNPVDKAYLNKEELDKILNLKTSFSRLERVRDAFIFSCFTGLAFSDIKNLKKEHLEQTVDGKIWIKKKRQKTKVMCNIPLLPIPQNILYKYKDYTEKNSEGYLLPVNSNQKMNAYLKEIADLCGIKKELTTHTARHTFATTVTLANKVSMEAVSKMLGHSDIKMTKIYARIVDSLVSDEMSKVVDLYK